MKQNLFKTLLLAATLLVGGANYAWADAGDETTNADINFSNAITDGVVAGSTNSMSVGAGVISDGWLRLYDGTSTITIPSAERARNKDVVKINFKMAWGNKNGMGSGFRIKDAEGTSIGSFQIARWDGSGTNSNTFGIESIGSYMEAAYNNAPITARYTQFEFTINYATNKISTYVSCPYASTSNTFEVTLTNTNPVASIEFWGYGVGGNYDRASVIDDVLIKTTEGDYSVVYANYTINYKIGDNLVKSVEGSDVVGSTITADAAVDGTEEGYVGNHYLIVAGSAPSMDLDANAASNVLDVPVRAPYTATLRVTTTIGGTPSVVDTPLTETDDKACNWSFAYSKYVVKDGVYYLYDDDEFAQSGTFTDGETIIKNITYSTADESIVRYYEGEASAGSNASYSYGGYGTVAAQNARNRGIYAGTLTPGAYRFEGKLVADGNIGRAITIREGTNDPMASLYGNNTTRTVTADFTVSSATGALYINGANSGDVKTNLSTSFDYVIIRKTAEVGTIPSSGLGSLASAYGLDFSSATVSEGTLTAYVVNEITVDKAKVTSVNEMPANSGVILEGTPGATYSIPVKADAAFAGTNYLQAAVTATDVEADEAYILQGGLFHLVTAASTVPAGKAYLLAENVPSNAKALSFDFGDADAINDVRSKMEEGRSEIFNLAGQRMNRLQKGVNIVNGKKVLVK